MLAMFVLFLLTEPAVASEGARFGLMLWAGRLLPSLLPFMILTQLLIRSGYLDAITNKLHIPYPYFVLFAGTLFGFPMGCKLTADLYERGNLSPKEAALLFVVANQMSPAFTGGYVMAGILQKPEWIPITYLILYAPSLCYGILRLHVLSVKKQTGHRPAPKTKKSTPELQMNTAVLDAGIMNSFETMLKLGGYIMLFSIITSMCKHVLAAFPAVCTLIAGSLEVTGAVSTIDGFFQDMRLKYIAVLASVAFGGCSGIAQTASILRAGKQIPGCSMTVYIRGRLTVMVITAALAALFYPLL